MLYLLSYLKDDQTIWEKSPLETLASKQQLSAFFHHGFWHPMDTLRDKNYLEELWANEKAPWKIWSIPSQETSPERVNTALVES